MLGALAAARAEAQRSPTRVAPWRPVVIGSAADERTQDARLLGDSTRGRSLMRSPSDARDETLAAGGALGVHVLAPDVVVITNSALPSALNEGALWAGRGTSALVRVGATLQRGRFRAVLWPEFTYAQNRAFDIRADTQPGRSPYAWPWASGRSNIDLPSRFGDRPRRVFTLGQSSLTMDAGPVSVGVATENEWWGPGVRDALLLSNAADGFPHAFVRTRRPLHTRVGTIEARYLAGTLLPSTFADTNAATRRRAFAGVAASLRPWFAPELTVGIARTSIAPTNSASGVVSRAADPLVRWETLPARADAPKPRADQYTSLFGRWLVPRAHAEVYGEWARQYAPRSLREMILFPQADRALTLGLQAARPIGAPSTHTRAVRTQLEFTNLEQSITFRDRPVPPPFYTGLATVDGYTNRGLPLGAAIGPGGSRQWLAVDLLGDERRVGLFVSRTRWNNDALYDQPNPTFLKHDVSASVGARALTRVAASDVAIDVAWSRRDNYLFQNGFANPGGFRTVDVSNVMLALHVTSR